MGTANSHPQRKNMCGRHGFSDLGTLTLAWLRGEQKSLCGLPRTPNTEAHRWLKELGGSSMLMPSGASYLRTSGAKLGYFVTAGDSV